MNDKPAGASPVDVSVGRPVPEREVLSMRKFELGQRVQVLAEMDCRIAGKTGVVVRLRRADEAAWVKMDCDLPSALRSFPADDECGRGNHIILWPQWCRAVLVDEATQGDV